MDKLDPNLNSPFQIDYKAIKEHRDAKKDEAKKLNRLLQGTRDGYVSGIIKSGIPEGLKELAKEKEKKEWTVLLYMDGYNDLEAYTANAFLDLESIGSDGNMNVVAEMGRISQEELKKINEKMGRPYEPTNIDGDWSGVRKYYVNRDTPGDAGAVDRIDSPVLEDLGEKDMSSPDTLAEFLTWGIKNYPAKHYMVVLMDHGGGWTGAFTNDATGSGGHIMSNPQIAEAFARTEKETGVKPDVVHMAACLMASTESAYELKNSANYLVASEEMGTTLGFQYGPILDRLQQDIVDGKEVTGESIAKSIVEHYSDKPAAFATKSAIDLSKMDNVKNALDTFAQKLRKTDTPKEVLSEVIEEAQNFSRKFFYEFYSHTRDLYSVAEKIVKSEKVTDKELKESATGMMKAVKDAVIANVSNVYSRRKVLSNYKSQDGKENISLVEVAEGKFDAAGLSIYLPYKTNYVDHFLKEGKGYRELATSKETEWDEFLVEKFGSPPKAEEMENKERPEIE
ncbi:MAG TPA: clostripain-related cysteine peptidase, partial [Candidatus Eremiobacteraeota bacterium]|nr:clostripain-related cysteine peptidase [Candidatus Eremiobacteraeota bacterium]